MSYYRKMPVLDAEQEKQFNQYLTEQYVRDLQIAEVIALTSLARRDGNMAMRTQIVFDKLATPRIYLLQAWLHRKSQEEAGVVEK